MDELKILLVEDDSDDVELLRDSFHSNNLSVDLRVFSEGDKVAAFLREPDFTPDIFIIDFNLPKVHGREILKMLKMHPTFGTVPIVVFSTSAAKEDIEFSKEYGAAHFITKPASVDGFNRAIQVILSCVKKY